MLFSQRQCQVVAMIGLIFFNLHIPASVHAAPELSQLKEQTITPVEKISIWLLQGSSTSGFIDWSMVNDVSKALETIIDADPSMKDILEGSAKRLGSFPGNWKLDFMLNENADKVVDKDGIVTGISQSMYDRHNILSRTGIVEIDRLNETFNVARIEYIFRPYWKRGELILSFSQPMDFLRLIRVYLSQNAIESTNISFYSRIINYPPFPHRRYREVKSSYISEIFYNGDGDMVFFIPKGNAWHFVFKRGRGDCPSGCTMNDYYYFTYDRPSGKAMKVSEHSQRDGWGAGGIYLWGIPFRHHTYPFSSYSELALKTKSELWWVSLHSVDVLGHLLTGPKSESFGEDYGFEALRDDVIAHRRDGLELLADSLSNPDADVKAVAHHYLTIISAEDFGIQEGSDRKWKEWLGTFAK